MTSQFAATPEELEFAKMSMPTVEPRQALQSRQSTSASKSKFAATPEELEFADAAMAEPIKEDVPWYQSYFNAAKQGSIQGIVGLGESIGSLINEDPFGESGNQFGQVLGVDTTPKEFQEMKKEKAFKPQTEEERQNLNEDLEKRYPANEGFVEGTIKRGTKLAPTVLAGPGGIGSNLARTGIAALAGETAKKLGRSETGQTIAEIAAFASPDLSKALVGSIRNPRQQEIIDFAKRMGLSDAEIAPALHQDSQFRRFLARWSYKGQGTQDKIKSSKKSVGNIYNDLRQSPEAIKQIDKNIIPDLFEKYVSEYEDLAPSLRKQLDPVFKDLLNSKGTGDDFIKFYQHAYQEVSDPKRIGKLQELTKKAIEAISPELGQDFRLANELYSNVLNTGNQLRPPPHADMMLYVKGMSALYGLWSGDYTWLYAATTPLVARQIATKYLTDPRMQNLGAKTVRALNNNQLPIANKLFEEFKELSRDESPELYDEIKDLNAEDFIQETKSQKR
jgi:predicted nucleic acid-binding OB-fold protein